MSLSFEVGELGMRFGLRVGALGVGLASLLIGATGAQADTAVPLPVRITDPTGDWQADPYNIAAVDIYRDVTPSRGPAFTPAVPLASPDIEWVNVRELPDGRHLVEAKVNNLFVYERRYLRSGDRRWLNTATQIFSVRVGSYSALAWVNAAGTGLEIIDSRHSHDWGWDRCQAPSQVTFSRVHDIVAITLPSFCGENIENTGPGHDTGIQVDSRIVLQRVSTVGTRVTSESVRNYSDYVSLGDPRV